MRVKAPFLIETQQWSFSEMQQALDAGYGVSSLLQLAFRGQHKICWVWAQGRRR